MGCFLGCFGFSCKRKRRKPAYRIQPGDQSIGSYEPLDSFLSTNLGNTENPISSESELRTQINSSDKTKKRSSQKFRKKVSFNLNVQTYEPIPPCETTDQFLESDEAENKYKSGAEAAKSSICEGNSMGSYPANYRYRNCIDSYDEEDEIAYEESDLDDDDYDDDFYDFEDDDDEEDGYSERDNKDQRMSQEQISGQFCSLSVSSDNGVDKDKPNLPLSTSRNAEPKSVGLNPGVRDRSHYGHSVLNPVENVSQWKAVKAKPAPSRPQRKENIALEQEPPLPFSSNLNSSISLFMELNYSQSKPLLQEIAVDASLSSWINSQNSDD